MKLIGEVVRIGQTDGHTILLGLRRPRGTADVEAAIEPMMAGLLAAAPESMAKPMREAVTKMAHYQHETHLEQAVHNELACDYILELTEREYNDLGKPGIGSQLSIEMNVSAVV